MQLRSLAALSVLIALAGCISADERQKMYTQPAPPHHTTPAARKAVATMAIRVNRFTPEAILLAAKDARFSVHHIETPSIGGGARTIYCVRAPITPMFLGKVVDMPAVQYVTATVRVMDGENGKLNTVSVNGECDKEPTNAFPELHEMARAMVESAKNRSSSPPPDSAR